VTSWTSSSSRRVWQVAALFAALATAGCSGVSARRKAFAGADGRIRVALLPLDNLSGGPLATKDVMAVLERAVARTGVEVVSGDPIDEFLARRRIRYTGGIDGETAKAAAEELGVDGVILTSVGLYAPVAPPKVGITMRLVSAADPPVILWMDSAARAGDDSPGLFELGVTGDVRKLERDVISTLGRSLAKALDDGWRPSLCEGSGAWSPQVAFQSRVMREPRTFSIAVLPFVNQTPRRGAGETIALEFVRQLAAVDGLQVMDPGVVRKVAISIRTVQEGGVSLENARLLTDIMDVDLIVAGVVRDYDDRVPIVDFTALVIHRRGRQVIWESTSHSRGDDTVTLFGAGKVGTSTALTCSMVRMVVDGMVGDRGRRRSPPPPPDTRSGPALGVAQRSSEFIASTQLLRWRDAGREEKRCKVADLAL
jgi:TolB-like protein